MNRITDHLNIRYPQLLTVDVNALVNVYLDLIVLQVMPVLNRLEVVDIGVNTI